MAISQFDLESAPTAHDQAKSPDSTGPDSLAPPTPVVAKRRSGLFLNTYQRLSKLVANTKLSSKAASNNESPDAAEPEREPGQVQLGGDGVDANQLAAELRPIYVKFLADLEITQPLVRFESEKLMDAVLEFARGTGVPHEPNTHSYSCLMVGYSYADNCFPYHPLDVKVYVTIYTWLATLCDDAERVGIVEDVECFQERYMLGEEQPTVLLRSWAAQLRLAYKYFHPLVANLIVCASFNLLTATATVARPVIKETYARPSPGGQSFPWYIRERDGVGEAYAWFTFPKEKYPDFEVGIEAIDDMGRFIAFVNDVLSFYKEQLNGDRDNYIYGVASHNSGDFRLALELTARDSVDCARRIEAVLKGKGKHEEAWRLHAAGYIHLHLMRSRYRLWEVGLGDKPEEKEKM